MRCVSTLLLNVYQIIVRMERQLYLCLTVATKTSKLDLDRHHLDCTGRLFENRLQQPNLVAELTCMPKLSDRELPVVVGIDAPVYKYRGVGWLGFSSFC